MTNLSRRKFLKFILKATGILAVAKILGLGWASNVRAWTEPTALPPSANRPAPINAGGDWQVKQGGVELNAGNLHAEGLRIVHGTARVERLHTPTRLRIPVGTNMFS